MDTFEALGTCRAMRYLKPDPVAEELIEKVIWGATRASNPGNSQGWDFVVVTDRTTKEQLQQAVVPAVEATAATAHATDLSDSDRRMLAGAQHLGRHFADVPVWIVVCARAIYPPDEPQELYLWSAVYPAAQNLIVAARALDLGTTFTTFHSIAEDRFREVLGIPEDVTIGAVIALGHPDRPFGPVKRKPVAEVIHREHW
jgi:nitroreductase